MGLSILFLFSVFALPPVLEFGEGPDESFLETSEGPTIEATSVVIENEEKFCAVRVGKLDSSVNPPAPITDPLFDFLVEAWVGGSWRERAVLTNAARGNCVQGLNYNINYRVSEKAIPADLDIWVKEPLRNQPSGTFTDGYYHFKCDDSGRHPEGGCNENPATVEFANRILFGGLRIQKQNPDDHTRVGGAVFSVSCSRPDLSWSHEGTYTTQLAAGGASGDTCPFGEADCGWTVCIGPIPLNSVCTIEERSSPTGFELADPAVQTITITDIIGDRETLTDNPYDLWEGVNVCSDAQTVTFLDEEQKVCFRIRKCEEGTISESCIPVPGTEFTVSCNDRDGLPVYVDLELETDENGVIFVDCLPYKSSCYINETKAPDNFHADTDPTRELLDIVHVCECVGDSAAHHFATSGIYAYQNELSGLFLDAPILSSTELEWTLIPGKAGGRSLGLSNSNGFMVLPGGLLMEMSTVDHQAVSFFPRVGKSGDPAEYISMELADPTFGIGWYLGAVEDGGVWKPSLISPDDAKTDDSWDERVSWRVVSTALP